MDKNQKKKVFDLPLRPLRLCGEKIIAFTLVELMVVIVVISILVGITLPVSKHVARRAREANQKIMLEKIRNALEDYRAAYGEYPITPSENGDELSGQWRPDNYNYVLSHYPENYRTRCYYTTNSPFTNVALATNVVETLKTDKCTKYVDYGLTYPLMLKQLDAGARPLMEFGEVTVGYLVYNPKEIQGIDVFDTTKVRRSKGGILETIVMQYIKGNAINRSKAIDPVSQKQWKYVCTNGLTYILTNHMENDY